MKYFTAISIHALLAESDSLPCIRCMGTRLFQSTLSLRRATTPRPIDRAGTPAISIHALLAESDRFSSAASGGLAEFQSTLSLRRATGWG